jgi:hypothetical protein
LYLHINSSVVSALSINGCITSRHSATSPTTNKTEAVAEHIDCSSAPRIFPAEILLLIARYTEDTEDLQRLRLVSRAFSHAATSAFQDRFTRIYILPLQPSMAGFIKLTSNPLIGPKIRRVNVGYGPPVAIFDSPRACLDIALHYGMWQQDVKDIMLEYNERHTDSGPADADSMSRTVVDSGEVERVLGEGLRRLPELSSVFMCWDASYLTGDTGPLLNLPEFLRLDIAGKRGGDKFDAIQQLAAADYVKIKILHYLYRSSIGRASPMEFLGALSQWSVTPGNKHQALSLFVPGLSFLTETAWTARLAREPSLLHESMASLASIELTIDCPRPPQQLAARLDTTGFEHHELSQGRRWCTLIQAASNLKVLRLTDISEWPAGFDNLLQLIFESTTWPNLAEISIRRDHNIGLLPFAPQLFDHSLGWYLFLQRDLDRFLIRH